MWDDRERRSYTLGIFNKAMHTEALYETIYHDLLSEDLFPHQKWTDIIQ